MVRIMKRLNAVILLLLCAAVLFSCGGAKRYVSSSFGMSADCPDGWQVTEDASSVCFTAPTSGANDDFYENVIYTGETALATVGAADLDAFVKLIAYEIGVNTSNYTELAREHTTIAGFDTVKLVYTCTSSQTSYVIKQCMYLICDGDSVHCMVYTANSETYDAYLETAESIVNSLKVGK